MKNIKKMLWILSFCLSALLVLASQLHWVGLQLTEVIGFITGGYCVWLAVVENIWNWPIGIVNAVAFTALFMSSKLYSDAGLQIVYIVLGFIGWYYWLHGGKNRTERSVSRIARKEAVLLTIVGIAATVGMVHFLKTIGDSAPFWDGLTTVSSLVAQYMLTRKYLENWLVWIATDVIYIGLYGYKHLMLTSLLYALFLTMCIIGYRDWKCQAGHKPAKAQFQLEGSEA